MILERADQVHQCKCERNWSEIDFTEAMLQSDGRLALSHHCDRHPEQTCVHMLSKTSTDAIKAAVAPKPVR